MPRWTPAELNEYLYRAQQVVHGKASAANNDSGLRAVQSKPDERVPLDNADAGKEASWHDVAQRFEIVFTVYSQRPCDWDGYDIKALQDFLCSAGIIPNDKWSTLSGRVLSRKAATKDEEKTVIEITPL